MTIETLDNPIGRIYLRPVTKTDLSEFLHLMKKSNRLHQPWISPPLTELSFHNYLVRIHQEDHEGLLVCQKHDNAITGVININNIASGSFLSASLGYYVGAPYAGQGLMREGLDLVKGYAFYTLGLHRLEANIQPENQQSIALVKHCGFVKEGLSKDLLFINGQWRDHERWTAIHPRTTLHP